MAYAYVRRRFLRSADIMYGTTGCHKHCEDVETVYLYVRLCH